MCVHSAGSASSRPQLSPPRLETSPAPSAPALQSASAQSDVSSVAREWARDGFTSAPAAASNSRPRIDLG
jgi:hypothetical protein